MPFHDDQLSLALPGEDNSADPPLIWSEQVVLRIEAIAKKSKTKKEVCSDGQNRVDMIQADLFVADLLDFKLKDDLATMEAPLFSLSTKPDMDTWKWISPDKKKWIEVTPSSIGRATIHDKDLLIYLTSQLMAAINEAARSGAKMPGRRIRFTLHDFLIATGRDTSGKSYTSVENTIHRLSGTRLKTNIEIGNIDRRSSFGLIERADYIIKTNVKGNKKMKSIEIWLSEWMYRALNHKKILTITPRYFTLRKPLEKRLYELARKHVGAQAEWVIKEDNLRMKTGSQSSPREFRRMLSVIIEDDRIPDYRMCVQKSDKGENTVRFYQKNVTKLALAYEKKFTTGKSGKFRPPRQRQLDTFD